ncbi:Vigilin [Araneus ventricosus]|uniref:Vigilin n=1 Tax=Araneus ventricosus TaxID=182803 RepID=A0A4Y2PJX2_ARAVE|nr:Vigilin [Araneus ventricosus]
MSLNNFRVEVPIHKQNHKFIIGKGGANIKKLRHETHTRIDLPAKGEKSNVIVIRGRKEYVLAAKEKILAIQKELDNVITLEIMIPAKLHSSLIGTKGRLIRAITEECGGVTIKFPTGGTGSDKVSIRGPKEDVLKAKKRLLEISNEKLRDETNTRIDLPAKGEESDVIVIHGRKEDVLAAKEKILAIQEKVDSVITQEIMIPAELHNSIIGNKGRLIRAITEECGDVTIKFPTGGTGSEKVSIRGPKEDVLKAKKRLLEISNEKVTLIIIA